MKRAIDETDRRRTIQEKYNEDNNITPETIKKAIGSSLASELKARKTAQEALHFTENEYDVTQIAAEIENEMLKAAKELDFERAAALRDQLKELQEMPKLEKKL